MENGGMRMKPDEKTVKLFENGRSTSYYKIEVKDELGNLTAVVNTTGYRVK